MLYKKPDEKQTEILQTNMKYLDKVFISFLDFLKNQLNDDDLFEKEKEFFINNTYFAGEELTWLLMPDYEEECTKTRLFFTTVDASLHFQDKYLYGEYSSKMVTNNTTGSFMEYPRSYLMRFHNKVNRKPNLLFFEKVIMGPPEDVVEREPLTLFHNFYIPFGKEFLFSLSLLEKKFGFAFRYIDSCEIGLKQKLLTDCFKFLNTDFKLNWSDLKLIDNILEISNNKKDNRYTSLRINTNREKFYPIYFGSKQNNYID